MQYVVVVLYFLILTGIGLVSRFQIRTPEDFYIAGKKGGVFQISGSLLGTILGGSAIIGTLELSLQNGWAAVWFPVCAALGLFLLAPLAKYVNRYGKFTLPELLGRFYGNKAEKMASVIIPLAWLGIIGAQIIGAAKILNSMAIMNYTGAAILCSSVFILYTLAGGQKSILKTDLIQSFLILSVLFFIFILAAGNPDKLQTTPMQKGLFHADFTVLDLIILFLTYSTTFIVGPDIYSRLFCAGSEKIAFRSVLIVAVILLPVAFILTYIGIHTSFPGETRDVTGLLISWQSLLPGWITGLLLAALLSAMMSSADTTLLTASMIVSELIYSPLTGKKSFILTQLSIVVTGILSLIISLYITSVIQSLLLALSVFSGAFFVPVLAGLTGLKARTNRILPAIITGGLLALGGKLTGMVYHEGIGNLVIVFSFIANAGILFLKLPAPFSSPPAKK